MVETVNTRLRRHAARKHFNELICRSAYGEGLVDLERRLQIAVSDSYSPLEVQEHWGYMQRIRFVLGNIDGIQEAISKLPAYVPAGCVEALIVYGFIEYAKSDYREAYRFFTRGIDRCKKRTSACDYELMRLHLLSAKCSWRQDNFTRSAIHLSLSLCHFKKYEAGQPPKDLYCDYYYGRILTVNSRLVNQRHGPGRGGVIYIDEVLETLTQAENYFSPAGKHCRLQRKEGNVGHLFLAEILELKAIAHRKVFTNLDADPAAREKSKAAYEEALEAARTIVEEDFPTMECRRSCHLDRIEGFTILREIQRAGRQGAFPDDTLERLQVARDILTRELNNRTKLFEGLHHSTLSRVYNNLAFVELLEGHFLISRHRKDQAKKIFVKVERLVLEAIKNNANNWRPEAEPLDDAPKQRLSFPQYLSAVNYRMEAWNRQGEISENGNFYLFKTVKKCYDKAMVEVQAELNKLTFITSIEDIGRRVRPLHEAMLEACDIWSKGRGSSSENKEVIKKAYFEVMQRAVSPYATSRSTGVSEIIKYTSHILPKARYFFRQLSDSDSSVRNDEKDKEELYECLDLKSTQLLPEPEGNLALFTDIFTEEYGCLIVQFIGWANIYLLCFAGLEQKVLMEPKLVRIPREARGFAHVSSVKLEVETLHDSIKALLAHEDKASPEARLSAADKEDWVQEIPETLKNLYKNFIAPLQLPDKRLRRIYVICDFWGWNIPWTALIDDKRPSEGRFLIEDFIVCQQSSLYNWLKQEQIQQDYGPSTEAIIVGAFSMSDENSENKFKHYLNGYRGLLHNPNKDAVLPPRDDSYFRYDTGERMKLLEEMERASILILIGHGRPESRSAENFEFILNEREGHERQVITPLDILKCDLSAVKLVVLLICEGGEGHAIAGAMPQSLSSAFHRAGAGSVIYSRFLLAQDQANSFATSFLTEIAMGTWFGEAYQNAIMQLIEGQKADRTSKIIYWSTIRLLGGQMCRFR